MTVRSTRAKAAAGLGLAASLFLTAAGCGGKSESVDDAVTVTPPGETSTTAGTNTAANTAAANPASADTKGAADKAKPAEGAAPKKETAAVSAEGWGTLKGHVVFGGDPPAPKLLVKKGDTGVKDPTVCAAQDIPSQKLVVDKASKGVKYALVYIPKPTKKNPDAVSAASSAKVIFDQKNCVFEPHVLAVMKGANVTITSNDQVTHNVNSKLLNTKFNSSLAPGQSITQQAQAPERPGPVVCDIHNWMTAYWLVTDSPYYAVTDDKGNFEIKNVPAGTQKVVVWQEAAQFVTPVAGDAIDIKAGGDTTVDFTVKPEKVKLD